MYSDSRKAQRNSFAHHRAELLFKNHKLRIGNIPEWAATVHEGTDPTDHLQSLTNQVRAGLLGFVPADTIAASI